MNSFEEVVAEFRKFFCRECKKERKQIVDIFKSDKPYYAYYNNISDIIYGCIVRFYRCSNVHQQYQMVWSICRDTLINDIKRTINAKTDPHPNSR